MIKEHDFDNMRKDVAEEHFSYYLFDSWSYSKVSNFARNEKDFEKNYIYCEPYRSSAANIAGSAYHEALERYFSGLKDGVVCDLVFLEQIAFEYIDAQPADSWKLQKTTPTIEVCIKKAYDTTTKFLHNFYAEISVYQSEIKEVLFVEEYVSAWVTVNGVDIPLPLKAKIDLIFKNHDDKIIIVDHKTKASFTDDKEAKFIIGKQAITYDVICKKFYGLEASEVWFVENKHSKNKNGAPQLNAIKVVLDHDTRRLYEAMLYEPLKRMLEAISDPNYIYLPNDNDNFIDKAEMYEFWARTMISDIGDFPLIPDQKKALVEKRLKKIKDASIASVDPKVIKNFKKNAASFIQYDLSNKDMTHEQKIEHVLKTLSVQARVEKTFNGFSSNTYLLEVGAGTKISTLFNYRLDIANALSVPNVRMMPNLFQYEDKSYLAIEAAKKRENDLMWDAKYLTGVQIPLGIDNFNNPIIWDLENPSTPHVLICGSTGSGKTVSIKSTVAYLQLAGVKDIIIIDPKCDPDFTCLKNTSGIRVINDIEEIEKTLASEVVEMNRKVKAGEKKYTAIIIDEMADAKVQSRKGAALDIRELVENGFYKAKNGLPPEPKMKMMKTGTLKSLEENLQIILQKGRSSGYRIISATQRASVKVINGDAKVNFAVQICFNVDKESSSRVVIDQAGAESLTGKGDALINSPEYLNVTRFQAFYKP